MFRRTIVFTGMIAFAALVNFSANAKEYKGNKFKGTVESVANDKFTLRDEEEETMVFFVVPKTEITRDEKPAELEDLQPDDVAIVTAARENGRMVALRVFVMEPQ